MIIESILTFFNFIDSNRGIGAIIVPLIVAGIIGISKIILDSIKEKRNYQYIKPSYWGLSKNFNITTVLEFFIDPNSSGYTQRQYSRPDLWKTIVIKVSFFGIYHKIVPIDEKAMLNVQVRRKRKSRDIYFNRDV
ncbi:hypothetical protein CH370_18755 [Leptospira kmetyi]|nr:hypothetical protein CH370_18755 [Leptospira kmetyi]